MCLDKGKIMRGAIIKEYVGIGVEFDMSQKEGEDQDSCK